MKFSIPNFLRPLSSKEYVVFKRSESFPGYMPYSDVDIITTDLQGVSDVLTSCARSFSGEDVRYERDNTNGHFHIDLFKPASDYKLDLRFDVSEPHSTFSQYNIDDSFWSGLFLYRQSEVINGVPVYFPANNEECMLRFLEYLQYHEERPDKCKHLRYIKKYQCWKFMNLLSTHTSCKLSNSEIREIINAS